MKSIFNRLLLVNLFLAAISTHAFTQVDTAELPVGLWPGIESKLAQPSLSPDYSFIISMIDAYCGGNIDSSYNTSYAIMIKLERRFNLPAAIYIGEEMVKMAAGQKDLKKQAKAYINLSRYYDAMGFYQISLLDVDRAIALFTQLGDRHAVLTSSMLKAHETLRFKKLEEVLPKFYALLTEAEKLGDTGMVNKIHLELIDHELEAHHLKLAEEHIEYVEKIPVSIPYQQTDYPFLILAAKGRANLAAAQGNLNDAVKFYQKALIFCEAEPSRWLEIHLLNRLAELEMNRGNTGVSERYLQKALSKAEKLSLHELLADTYDLKTKLAEKQNRFEDALAYFKLKQLHDEKFKARSDGFSMENYYLQKDKEELRKANENNELELTHRSSQIGGFITIIFVGIVLSVLLGLGFVYQRNKKIRLAAKNRIIEQQTRHLEVLDAARSRFFTNVTHELRTSLTLILGPISTVLKENKLSEKQFKLLQTASANSSHLNEMVNEILDLRKLETGKMVLHEEPTPLHAFFTIHLSQFQSLAEYKQIVYSTRVDLENNITANIDREKYKKILYNLLSNALKFTPAGGEVKVQIWLQENELHVQVDDTGIGIPQEELSKVFDRYYQTNNNARLSAIGTGIGLSICKDYVELMEGDIEVNSLVTEGSSFLLTIPITQVSLPQGKVNPIPLPEESNWTDDNQSLNIIEKVTLNRETIDPSKPTLLVVEDNPGLQSYISMVVGKSYNVLTADNGKIALDTLLTGNGLPAADLIISDLMMPVMDGFELLEELKSGDKTRHIPVIMLTARADTSDRLSALRIGVDDYMVKPFEEEELMVRIANLLTNQAIRRGEKSENGDEKTETPILSPHDQEWLENFEDYILKNISNRSLSVSNLSLEFAMSESTLLRNLKRLTGLTPSQYLQEIRLNAARKLLESRSYKSVTDVAIHVGYSDARSFSRSFKNRFGKLPSDIA